jgi:hypothetical protein
MSHPHDELQMPTCSTCRDALAETENARAINRQFKWTLATHWLKQLECMHDERRDVAWCACGWHSAELNSVGEAVWAHIEHAWKIARYEVYKDAV